MTCTMPEGQAFIGMQDSPVIAPRIVTVDGHRWMKERKDCVPERTKTKKARQIPRLAYLQIRYLQILIECLLDDIAGNITHDLLLHLSTLEDQRCRTAAHIVVLRRRDVLVDIHLCNLHTTAVAMGYFIDDWRQCTARTAPPCPKIDQHWLIGLQYSLVEIRIRHFHDSFTCHLPSLVSRSSNVHAAASRTFHRTTSTAKCWNHSLDAGNKERSHDRRSAASTS